VGGELCEEMLHGKYLFMGRQEDSSEGTSTQDYALLVLLHTDSRSRTSSWLVEAAFQAFHICQTPNLGCIAGHMAAEVGPANLTGRESAIDCTAHVVPGAPIFDYHSTWLGILAPANEVW
jgi:hypothetical protein